MLHEPSNCALYKRRDTTETSNNYRCCNDWVASFDLSDSASHKSTHTGEEHCESKDCEKSLTLCSNIPQDQRHCTEEKEYGQRDYDDSFLSTYSLMQQTIYIGETPHQCGQCRKCFSTASSLTVHQRTDSGQKPYKCNVCDKLFTQWSSHKTHQRRHTGEKPYKCKECDIAYTHYASYRRHQKSHSLENLYECKESGKSFLKLPHLKRHEKIHTGEKSYKCEACNKSFTVNSTLKRHQKIHTGEKLYKCMECDKFFTQASHVKTHQRVHTGERPYRYKECDLSTQLLANIRKFILGRHHTNAKTVTNPLWNFPISEDI